MHSRISSHFIAYKAHLSIVLAVVLLLLAIPIVANSASNEVTRITQLKHMNFATSLVEKGRAQAIIVAPAGGRYQAEAVHIQEQVRKLTSVNLAIYRDDILPVKLLGNKHVIALGNMATNAFIETLYRQWQVVLDLTYPGEGGYVVRSLHNPYGTGRNVIFLGGSDDAGVTKAVSRFCDGLKGGATIEVGWLLDIKLGKGYTLPEISADLKEWKVHAWNDSWRKHSDGRESGYPPATYFGWNPISIAGALYYLTGRPEYLKTFKQIALPDPQHPPAVSRTCDAFADPADPLAKSSHYRSHLVDLIYDLIEESPLFSDEERLLITNKLAEHQFELDPGSSYSRPAGDRHGTWHMLCIYTGSRYFSRYYPDPVWGRRIENVRKGFVSFSHDPTWGGGEDTLYWVATFIEPVFDFALLDGPDEFVKSGAARTLMKGLESLMTGDEVDDYNQYLPANLLFKAAFLLKDSRYVWMAKRLSEDFSIFRIGQSFWPASAGRIPPPADMIGRVTVSPLSQVDRRTAKTPIPAGEAFQVFSYRAGLDKADDFLLLDGFAGTGRHPFQLNTLLRLRMFGGKNILNGYNNDLWVWRDGMAEPHVARSAALKENLSTNDFAYIATEVPDMPWSRWQRRIVYLKNECAIVVDRVTAREAGRFDLLNSWEFGSGLKSSGKSSRRVAAANGAALSSAEVEYEQVAPTTVQGRLARTLRQGESVSLASLFFNAASPMALSPLRPGGYLITGKKSAFVGFGPVVYSPFSVKAEFSYFDDGHLLLEEASELVMEGKTVFSSDLPVTIYWNFNEQTARVSARASSRVRLGADGSSVESKIAAGEQAIPLSAPGGEAPGLLRRTLAGLERYIIQPLYKNETAKSPLFDRRPVWELSLKGKISALAKVGGTKTNRIWIVSQNDRTTTLFLIDNRGHVLQTIEQQGEAISVLPAKDARQARMFSLLAGFRDDTLRAYAEDGQEIWEEKAVIHPSFKIGDRYEAPWFTDPNPPYNMRGIFSLLAGDYWSGENEQIAVGRPSTVEIRTLDGKLIASVPIRWGNVTSLAVVQNRELNPDKPMLLIGKAYTGNPALSGINSKYQNVSDFLFDRAQPEYTNMHSWLMRGMAGLRATDLNADGTEEVIYTLSGHWNELRVYGSTGGPLWTKFFGPDKRTGAAFMTALDAADLIGDGFKQVIVATRFGWLVVFDHSGNRLWSTNFENPVTCLSVNEKQRLLAVGREDGALVFMDASGKQLGCGNMGSAVTSVFFDKEGVVAGSANGAVKYFKTN